MTTSAAPAAPAVQPTAPFASGARTGLVAAMSSAAAFGTSGPFAKALLVEGWTSGAIVLLRVGGAALVLAVPAALALRGRWTVVRANLGVILLFGLVAVAGCQVAYFNAVGQLPIGVALLLEYSGTVLVVLWVWLRTQRAPSRTTLVGAAIALAGLALVLDITGQAPPQLGGVVWGLVAAVGLATYFVSSSHRPRDGEELPPVALAALGMGVGAVALGLVGAVGLLPMRFATADVLVAGRSVSWWAPVAELAVIAAAAAYLLGTLAVRRLGATVSSFVGLSEVLFAIVFAWLLLDELPRPVQLAGGALVVAGVVAVRVGEARQGRPRAR
ncbi:MAG: EamA family transporter [Actinomycetota bacterium]|nr:EamA family transporter [Actinomycetota bacterium]